MSTVRLWRRALNKVEVLDVEEYLRGVVHSEMPASWSMEALKAQAIAARTYVMHTIDAPRHGPKGADICDTAQCQAYSDKRYDRTDAAVRETVGSIWPCDGSYVSKCGRPECPYCQGSGGYNGQTWTGRMCQYGAAECAKQGKTCWDILALYYGGSVGSVTVSIPGVTAPETVYIPVVITGGTDWSRYPGPPNNTRAGVHGGSNYAHPLGDNDGLIPGMLDEMKSMGQRWVKLLDGDGSSYNACRMVLQAGMMPVVRLYRLQPYPGMLTQKQRDAVAALTGIGVCYFERGNEPNLDVEWQPGKWPGQDWNLWTPDVFKSIATDWIGDADYIASLGAFVAVDALSPGGNYDDIMFLQKFLTTLKQMGVSSLLKDHGWLSVHNAGLNHPYDYPDDAINQAEHPGQTIHTHYYPNGAPTGASNCIRKYEAVYQVARDILGLDLPVICTEGGWWVGNAADDRYPTLSLEEASDRQATTLRAMETAPPYLLAQMPWLWFNRKGAGTKGDFERDAWKRWPGFGNCPADEPEELPVIAMLKAHPVQPKGTSMTIQNQIGAALQKHIIPLVPTNAFAQDALAKGYYIASDEVYETFDGVLYCYQGWRDPANEKLQHIVYSKVITGTSWWEHRAWFEKLN